MRIRYFAHSWLSDWNHGNAHFLRGLASALVRRGHRLRLYEAMPEPRGGWSLAHLWKEPRGPASVAQMRAAYPELTLRLYGPGASGPDRVSNWRAELRGADLVIAHEWNPPELFRWLARRRHKDGFRLLLHDTHHRALSQPDMLRRLPLGDLDGVLAFGESLRQLYERQGVRRSFTFHEAADTERFFPRNSRQLGDAPSASGRPLPGSDARPQPDQREGGSSKRWPCHSVPRQNALLWIGNWGDEERTRELDEFLLQPARAAAAPAQLYGVRYPAAALARLRALGMGYGGYLANLDVPQAYAAAQLALHIPRRPYAAALPGIPTIRVFEALACGMPLLCAPWTDSEGLFTPGADFWVARTGAEMQAMIEQLLAHPEQRMRMGARGAATIAARHTCAHRARQLEEICQHLD